MSPLLAPRRSGLSGATRGNRKGGALRTRDDGERLSVPLTNDPPHRRSPCVPLAPQIAANRGPTPLSEVQHQQAAAPRSPRPARPYRAGAVRPKSPDAPRHDQKTSAPRAAGTARAPRSPAAFALQPTHARPARGRLALRTETSAAALFRPAWRRAPPDVSPPLGALPRSPETEGALCGGGSTVHAADALRSRPAWSRRYGARGGAQRPALARPHTHTTCSDQRSSERTHTQWPGTAGARRRRCAQPARELGRAPFFRGTTCVYYVHLTDQL